MTVESLVVTPQSTLVVRHFSLDQIICIWTDEKVNRTHSAATERAYVQGVQHFRALLQRANLDLDSDPHLVVTLAQGWAGQRQRGGGAVSSATYNQRLAILSSFYQTAIKRGMLTVNPVLMIDRRPVEHYAGAAPLNESTVRQQVSAIDRITLEGLRDYALLGVFLNMGRRRAEVHGLRWAAVQRAQDNITLTFRAKGAKVMRDTLSPGVTGALLQWLHGFYGEHLDDFTPATPIWVSLSRNSYGKPLSARSFSTICQNRLDESKVHALRHTSAHAMQDEGAKLSDIRDRLGQANSATTDIYLQKLSRAKNEYGACITARFGFEES